MSRAWRGTLATATLTLLTVTALAGPAAAVGVSTSVPASAAELEAKARQQQTQLTEEQQQQAITDAEAFAALEAYQLAQRRADEAARQARAQAARLLSAKRATELAQERLARYIASMYRSGMGDTRIAVLSSLASSENPEKLFSGLGLAQQVGTNQNDAVDGLTRAQATQATATARAESAEAAEEAATLQAAEAKTVADAAVAAAAARVAAATEALIATKEAAGVAAAREALMAQAEVIARQRSGIPPEAIDGAYALRPVAECVGGTTTGYPNGRIPTTALCPLWGTAGQILRADAAAAFNEMSRAYAQQFGAPICVTDSYRDYPSQVAVAAAKPTLAAFPGSSNHGWGVATDLCDGIESYSSPQHQWMVANSMAYGYFLPGWAQAGGSKPEPWHWEFAG